MEFTMQPMSRAVRPQARQTHAQAVRLGDRLRQLRVAAGMTQTELAGDRFSKEYVSQIERGKTRPTRETVEWLASRLGVDPSFLQHGVSADERERIEATLARADALSQSDRFAEAIREYDAVRPSVGAVGSPELEVRMLAGEAWARMRNGEVHPAIELLNRARDLADGPSFSDVDRADLLYR